MTTEIPPRSELSGICEAIRDQRRLRCDYAGYQRVVEPYCHGLGRRGEELLRAVQVGGSSRSRGFGFGKLWSVAKMTAIQVTDEPFTPDDPHYNPDDSALAKIHCRVQSRWDANLRPREQHHR